MASKSEKAHTCKLPSRDGEGFLRFNCPDWSKIDIIGQTIIMAELAPRLGSFQNACKALNLQSNEVQSFISTHLHYQQASKRGEVIAKQWGRDRAVPADDDDDADIPQQRPVLVVPSSIGPACTFLEALGYHDYAQAVWAWSRRHITWPPYICIPDLDTSQIDQPVINFPVPKRQRAYTRYTGSLGNDDRSMVGFVGAWRPNKDGSPDTRISFINVPKNCVVFGPGGSRELIDPGRYSVCWRVGSLANNEYNDFVFAKNTSDNNEDGSNSDLHKASHIDQYLLLTQDGTVNPKAISRPHMPDTYNSKDGRTTPFHPRHEPQGPSRELTNPKLQQTWSDWNGQIFQFRLPHEYTILGPQGYIVTFDPPNHERYDERGNPRGIGGMYHIVQFQQTLIGTSFKMDELPPNVPFRFKITERLVLIRNGMVLPGFVETGVHEWSTQEGRLDLYNARGCYEVLKTEGCYSILPGVDRREVLREELSEQAQNETRSSSVIDEAMELLEPHRDWLNQQEAEELRFDEQIKERARFEARRVREKDRQKIVREERETRQKALQERQAQEQARVEGTVAEDAPLSQIVKSRRAPKQQSSDDQADPNLGALSVADSRPGHSANIAVADIAVPGRSVKNKATPRRDRQRSVTKCKSADGNEDEGYTVIEDAPLSQIVKNRRALKKQSSSDQVDPNLGTLAVADSRPGVSAEIAVPGPSVQNKATPRRDRQRSVTKRKCADDNEDEEYTPARSRTRSAQQTPTPRKPQGQPTNNVSDIQVPQPPSVPARQRTRAATSRAWAENGGPGIADSGVDQSSALSTRRPLRRLAPKPAPIDPLPEAIQSVSTPRRSGKKLLGPSTVPKVKREESTDDAAAGVRRKGRG